MTLILLQMTLALYFLGTILFLVYLLRRSEMLSKIALGIVSANNDEKPLAGRKAMLFSRTNTALSIPMLYAMVSAQNLY